MDSAEEFGAPTVLSLCSGGGGLDLGVELALGGVRAVAYVEIEAYAAALLVEQMEKGNLGAAPVWTNLRTFDGGPFRGLVDVLVGGYPCFVEGTLILTESGHKPIESVRVGDRVLTHKGRWRDVVSTSKTEGASVRTIRSGLDITCTDGHPFYARSRSREWNNRFRRYERKFGSAKWVRAGELSKDSFVSQVLPGVVETSKSEEYWWVIGRYLADGWLRYRKSRGTGLRDSYEPAGRIVICCAKTEQDFLQGKIEAAGWNPRIEETRTTVNFHIFDKELYWFLRRFGRYAHGKKLPKEALCLPKRESAALFEGYLSGDGSVQKCSRGSGFFRRITTVSPSLALGFSIVAQRAFGVVPSVRLQRVSPTTRIEGRLVNQRPQYILNVPNRNRVHFTEGSYGWRSVRSNEPSGTATVYNIGVEEDESYTANGLVVHNCQPFSVAGKKLGEKDPRHLWPEIARVIGECEPGLCFFENVGGHLRQGGEQVCRELGAMGYSVAAGLFTAEEIGAGHKRERLFIMAYRTNERGQGVQLPVRPGEQGQAEADADGGGEKLAEPARELRDGSGDRWSGRRGEHTDGGEQLADACGPRGEARLPGQEPREKGHAKEPDDDSYRLPDFPPGPNDRERWRRVLQAEPSFEPSVCGVADGMADRVDKLRMLGNGVVPLAAAYAFVTLWSALRCGDAGTDTTGIMVRKVG